MMRISRIDALVLGTLLPVWLVTFALHARQITRTGLAQPSVFVAGVAGESGHPRVRGFRLEQRGDPSGLRIGDRVLTVGGVDLRGVGHIGFDAYAIEHGTPSSGVPVVFERGGVRHEALLPLVTADKPWMRIPAVFAVVFAAVLILLRTRRVADARLFFLAAMLIAISQTPFHGGGLAQTTASKLLFYLLAPVGPALMLRWAMTFPPEAPAPPRAMLLLPWLVVPVYALLRASFVYDGLLPSDRAPAAVTAMDGLVFLAILASLTRNFSKADPIGRRRVKWVLYGFYLALAPVTLTAAALALLPRSGWHDPLLSITVVLMAAAPLGILIGVIRYQIFDINRLISVTAAYTTLAIAVVAGSLTFFPRLAHAVSQAIGVDPASGQLAFSLAVATVAIPLGRRLRPLIDRAFFRERWALETGMTGLLADLAHCGNPEKLLIQTGERLADLLRPESDVIYGRSHQLYAPVFIDGRVQAPSLEERGALIRALERGGGPIEVERLQRRRSGVSLGPADLATLRSLQAVLLVPILRASALIAFVSLGAKRSGDIYTSTDLALLTALAGTISNHLLRFDEALILAKMRSYVPGAVADEIASGRLLEEGECIVSVLFVDIRGYATYAESLRAQEIFSTVNRYTALVSEIVRRHGGSVVEFNGDGMMVVFGAPTPLPRMEWHAVAAGREIMAAMAELRGDANGSKSPTLAVGIGIATGSAYVGNIRAVDRLIWSAVGNTTNLAARLQGLTRELDAAIVIDASTHDSAEEVVADFERRARIAIRGRDQMEDVYLLPGKTRGAMATAC